MDPSCLRYALTDAERDSFEREGYLVVTDALPPAKIALLTSVVDRLLTEGKLTPPGDAGIEGRINALNFAGMDPALLDMVDHPRTFPKVWGILGWNIYLYHSHMAITSRSEGDFDPNGKTFGWHQDSGRLNQDMETNPRPRISLKVGYFLTDLTEPGRGNFWIIPGSQLKNQIELPASGLGQPNGATPLLVSPGTAVIFDRRLWHCATANKSSITRKALFYGYGYRWIRTRDDMTIPKDLYEAADPVRKQILGHTTREFGRSSPADEDVPLRVWLREHQPEVAAR